MPDKVKSERSDLHAERASHARRSEPHSPQDSPQHTDHEQAQGPEAHASYHDSLLGDPRLNARGNESMRAAVLLEAQQTYGNRALQRYLQRARGTAAPPVDERLVERIPSEAPGGKVNTPGSPTAAVERALTGPAARAGTGSRTRDLSRTAIQRAGGKKKAAAKPKAPPKPKFTLSGLSFEVDGATVKPKGKDGGWKFTATAGAATGSTSSTSTTSTSSTTSTPTTTPTTPAAPAEFAAERTMAGSEYESAGSSSSLGERTKVKVASGKATVDTPVAVLPAAGAPQLTIALDSKERGTTKQAAVGAQSVSALDVTLSGLTPKDGDTISISPKGKKELYVFTTLKPPSGTEVKGFFDIGYQTKYKGTVGVAGEGRAVAEFDATFDKLAKAGSVSAGIQAEKDIFAATSEIEGHFDTVQTYDTGVLTFGFSQWTANASLPQMLKAIPGAAFQQHLGQYGLGLGTPTLGTEKEMRKLVPPKALAKVEKKLALRNASEGSMTLNGKELISSAAYALAQSWSSQHAQLITDLTALKADAAGTDAAKAKQAAKTIDKRWADLAGLPGIPKSAPKTATADQKATTLIAGVTAAKTEADSVAAGAQSIEAIRTNEWVLRFQVAGQDPEVQAAELKHAHDTLTDLKKRTAGTGVPYGTLLPTDRGLAVLYSTFLNNPSSVLNGLKAAVPLYRKAKVDEADKAIKAADAQLTALSGSKDAAKIAEATKAKDAATKAKAAWEKFPWPTSDGNWGTYYTAAAAKEFEQTAEPKMLKGTTDPTRRAGIMNKHFTPYKGIGRLPDEESARQSLAERVEARAAAGGSNLDRGVQRRLEDSLGADLSGVRVHTGSEANSLTRSIEATAFSSGQDIFFSEGSYDPSSPEGMKVLAHEAAHTVQHSAGPTRNEQALGGVSISEPSDSAEQAAETAASRVTPAVQRQPAPPTSTTSPTPADTVTDTDAHGVTRTHQKAGWNKGEARFEKKGWARAITRHRIAGLTGVSQPKDDTKDEATHDSDDKGRKVSDVTAEQDNGAILLIPDPLSAKEATGVDVLLYLHGHGIGFRERQEARWEEGGGKVEKTVPRKVKGKTVQVKYHQVEGMEAGTVRDVDVDHMEEQLGDSIKASSRPTVAVMPQGAYAGGADLYGKDFNSDAYIKEVFDKASAQVPRLKDTKLTAGRVVLAGHSGAGNVITPMLGKAAKVIKQAAAEKWTEAKKQEALAKIGLPTNMDEVVLFDAINSAGQLSFVENWVSAELNSELEALAAESDPAKQLDFVVNHGMRFRGYHSPSTWPAKDAKGNIIWKDDAKTKPVLAGYKIWYDELDRSIAAWFRDADKKYARLAKSLRGVSGATLDSQVLARWQDNYQVKEVSTGHEKVMGTGKIEPALEALSPPAASTGSSSTGTTHAPAPAANGHVPDAPEAVQRALVSVQRNGPAADPDKVQWDADWNDAAFSSARPLFSETSRPTGTPKERYDKLCPLYKAHGIARPLQYLATQINQNTSFFGSITPAHTGMQAMLTAAENTIKGLKDDKGNPKYPGFPFKQKPWALTVRTTSTGVWSNHAGGKAIDLDPDTNPHLLDAGHRAVITALTGMDIEKSNPGKAMGLDSYDADKMASDRFQASYNEAGITKRIEDLKPAAEKAAKERDELTKKQADLAASKKQIARDRDAVLKNKSATAQDKKDARAQAKAALAEADKQAAALKTQLKAKGAELSAAQNPIKVLEQELKRFKAEQKKYDAATKAVETAETAVTDSSAKVDSAKADLDTAQAAVDLAQKAVDAGQKADLPALKKALAAAKKERDTKKAALTKAQTALKAKQKALAGKEGSRDAFTLRKYGREGFLNLPKDIVAAMKGAGFKWGGDWGTDSNSTAHKDMMHFDMP